MELFIGLALELMVSIFLCFFLAKFVSSSATDRDHHRGIKKRTTHHRKFKPDTETKNGFASEAAKVDSFCGSATFGQELLNQESYVSPNLAETVDLAEEVTESDLIGENNQGEIELVKEDESEEVEALKREVDENEDDDDDDWEGVERSELERVFGAAVVYVGSEGNADKISRLGSHLKLQFYGLHKVAIEGPCLVPQPMALKISARAKWNAWQQLGNMSPEDAMENYIDLLSRSIPKWIDDCIKDGKQNCPDTKASWKLRSDNVVSHNQGHADERKMKETML